MSEIFISYARSAEQEATRIAEALRALGHGVWRDDELPAHRDYSEVIEERLRAARAVVVVWSAEAVKSQWVRAEADIARESGTLVQLTLDGASLPMPFNRIQCADLSGWSGEPGHAGWRKVLMSVAELVGQTPSAAPPVAAPPVPPSPSKPSVAILAFANLSNDPEQDYFAQGMAEEIGTALTRYPSLFVVPAASASRRDSPSEIARALGVRYLLDGSVRKAGDRVRITVKLADAIDNLPIWSERFDGTLTDIFALQDEVAGAAATKIAPNITVAETRRATSRPTKDMNAYDLVLRAAQSMRRNEPGDLANGLALCEQAIALDPNYAAALATAAFALSLLAAFGEVDPEESRRVGLEYARRALKAQDNDPEIIALVTQAEVSLGADITVTARMLERALEQYPGVSHLWHASGYVLLLRKGQPQLAQAHFEEAMRLDACHADLPFNQSGLGTALVQQGRFEEAIAPLSESLRLAPSNVSSALSLAVALTFLGRPEEARKVLAPYKPEAIANLTRFASSDLREQLTAFLKTLGVDV